VAAEADAGPMREIALGESQTGAGSHSLTARVEVDGTLVLEGYDTGELPKQFFGDSDYEYWLTVKPEQVPAVLLWLLKERFSSTSQFKEWLAGKGIPNEFFSY
jgi:hypothetical protein